MVERNRNSTCLRSCLIPVRLIRWSLPVAIHVSASGVPTSPQPIAPTRLSVTRNKTIKQLMKPCSFFHVRRYNSYIFNLLIIALVSSRQVKEARSCFGTWYPNWAVFSETFCRGKCESEGNKLMLWTCLLLFERIFCSREIRNHLPKITSM
jgi:hypothetical protein